MHRIEFSKTKERWTAAVICELYEQEGFIGQEQTSVQAIRN